MEKLAIIFIGSIIYLILGRILSNIFVSSYVDSWETNWYKMRFTFFFPICCLWVFINYIADKMTIYWWDK